ncbi:MAG: hypothetical protein JW751_20530 [Polyangiaceae bacterium]|nr:hypothetical protein [Polyangiaceae bacterium]
MLTIGGLAATTGVGRAESPTATVWYRTSEQCPDAATFLSLVEARGRRARVAEVGDRVDFVVTLGAGAEGSAGRLERQTSTGTVAIREVVGARCEEVADAIALSLTLALAAAPDAGAKGVTAGLTPAEPVRAAFPAVAPPAPSAAAPAAPDSSHPPPAPEVASSGAGADARPAVAPLGSGSLRRRETWVGVSVNGRAGVAPAGAWGGAGHVEVGRPHAWTIRGSAAVAAGTHTLALGRLHLSLWVARIEVCPLQIGRRRVVTEWCGGGELGRVSAEFHGPGGRRDAGLWTALVAGERLRWQLTPALSLETELGLAAPLPPYRVVTERPTAVIFEMDPLGLEAAVGASIRLP